MQVVEIECDIETVAGLDLDSPPKAEAETRILPPALELGFFG